jgi:hypothetical protein
MRCSPWQGLCLHSHRLQTAYTDSFIATIGKWYYIGIYFATDLNHARDAYAQKCSISEGFCKNYSVAGAEGFEPARLRQQANAR